MAPRGSGQVKTLLPVSPAPLMGVVAPPLTRTGVDPAPVGTAATSGRQRIRLTSAQPGDGLREVGGMLWQVSRPAVGLNRYAGRNNEQWVALRRVLMHRVRGAQSIIRYWRLQETGKTE